MSLSDEVQTRTSEKLLIALTNQDVTGPALSINTDVLDAAVADAQAEFGIQVGVSYDNSIASHVAAGVKGVLYYLQEYTEAETAAQDKRRKRWFSLLSNLAGTVGGEKRILPSSDSPLEPSTQQDDTRPDFDRSRWDDMVPDMPHGGEEDDNPRGRG